VDHTVRGLLADAHRHQPFSPLDARLSARRAAALIAEAGVETTLYRGGLYLRGVEADHVWLAASADGEAFVVDTAFPLFSPAFREQLRRFVCGDSSREELAAAAEGSELDDRILGVFPAPVAYLGSPVWSAR
jgi:hypothetical protein